MRCAALFPLLPLLPAADWYVAPTGSDSAAGTEAAPLATLGAALAASASGDRILLQRGGTWRETGRTVGANRTLTAYGSGADPVLTASTAVTMTGSGSIKTASVASRVLGCWVNGTFVRQARFPNTGWLVADLGTGVNQISDGAVIHAPGRWTGAQVRWRRWSWFFETRTITNDSGAGTLALDTDSAADVTVNGGDYSDTRYYIDNDLDELDAPGEWHWEGGTLHLYPPTGVDPATMTVEVVTGGSATTLSGGTIENVAFRRWNGTALSVANAAGTVRGCTFADLDTIGIAVSWNSGASIIDSCVFTDIRNTAITWNSNRDGVGGGLVQGNRLERIGMEPGLGGSGTWNAAGIVISNAKTLTVTGNRIADTGYAGIIVGEPGQTVSRNVFVRCMGTLNDGAAIYTNCGSTTIRENIILDTVGNLSSSHPWWPLGHGIWPEFLGDYELNAITGNTVYGSNGNGIFLRNNYRATIDANVCLDNRTAGLFLSEQDNANSQSHTITNNVLGIVTPTRRVTRTENLENPAWVDPPSVITYETGIDYGSMSGTRCVVPLGTQPVRTTTDLSQSLDIWKSTNPSWADPSATLATGHAILLINDTEATVAMPVPAGTWTTVDGAAVGASVTIAAFRSVVLVGATAPAAIPPYYTASGRDYRAASPWTVGDSLAAPAITAHPANTSAAVGSTATFGIAATGNPAPTYQWQEADRGTWTNLPGATSATFTTATLALTDDLRQFRCRVENSQGTATSNTATLSVSTTVDPTEPPAGPAGGGCGAGALAALLLLVGLRRR